MRFIRPAVLSVAVLLVSASVSRAATFVVPTDEVLIGKAGAIVSGVVLSSHPRFDQRGSIETVHTMLIEEVLKGQVHARQVEIVEWGGAIGEVWMAASGAPHYEVGQEYVVFLTENRNREWTTLDLSLGQFERSRDRLGRPMLLRTSDEIFGWDMDGGEWKEPRRRADGFVAFIREVVAGRSPEASYFEGEAPHRPRAVASQSPTQIIPNTNLDFESAANVGLDKWVNHSGSTIDYDMSATPATSNVKNALDTEDKFIEDDPNGDIAGAFTGSGVVATAFYGGGGSNSHNSENFVTICCADVVSQNGLSSSNFTQEKFNTTMVHEVGHTLGFRHSNQSPSGGACNSSEMPCTSAAVMNSSVTTGFNGNLQPYDSDAANECYGNGSASAEFTGVDYVTTGLGGPNRRPNTDESWRLAKIGCAGPSITTQPASSTIGGGQSVNLTISATASEGSLTFQWYRGTAPSEADPVGTSSNTFNTGPLTSTTSFWVKLTDACATGNPKNSNTATITVNCNPTITNQPQNKSITSGQSTSLSVTSSQSTTFEWFEVTNSAVNTDESNPVGTNSSSFNTGTLTSTKKYWVKASTSCGFTRSNVVTVTVSAPCNTPTISSPNQPQSTSITSGGSATLTVNPSGTSPFTFQWFRATSPNQLNPVGTNSPTLNTGVLTTTTSFWVRVSNTCGNANSNTAIVTVVSCTLPSILTQPLDLTINSGATAILTIALVPPGGTVNWFRGAPPDKTNPVGTGETVTVGPLTATTTFWAAVANTCGEVPSRVVTISIAACTPAAIATQPQASTTIKAGETVTLSVAATGTAPLTFAWFQGEAGDTSVPVGTNASSFTSERLLHETKFWVRVSNACGTVNSDAAAVKIPLGRRRSVR